MVSLPAPIDFVLKLAGRAGPVASVTPRAVNEVWKNNNKIN
jgi:hypothetical protein